jgi:serine phosphatase RsbU (regulator of sigma subunit)/anti-sigma regulatory factor (Ser/Thr protein kinase)
VRSLNAPAERFRRALRVLVDAGRALTLCASVQEALRQVASAIVAEFADYCSIEVRGSAADGLRSKVEAGVRPDRSKGGALLEEPLSDGRTIFGAISCATSDANGFDEVARESLHVLSTELAVILAAQMLMQREHRVADRLQRALLPGQLPVIEGAEFHAAYRPASDEAEIGGDWFDAFALPDQRVAISIGDVAGHGLDAAIIMGEVRQAIRTAAIGATSPAAVLGYVNRMLAMRDSVGMVTAIFGIYDPPTGNLSFAVAGHPPPLLALRNGMVRALPTGSLPLGCVDELNAHDWTFTLPAGARAIFYTDGLIENDRDVNGGEKRLIASVRLMTGSNTGEDTNFDPALALQELTFKDDSNRDDAAVLVLTRHDPVCDYFFSAVPVVSAITRAIVSDELDAHGIANPRRFGILVALGEAIANAVEHAYRGETPGLVHLALATERNDLVLTVEDFGRWRPFVRREERGRGFDLMHAFMDGVQVRSTRKSTSIVLKAKVHEAAPA